MRSHGRHNVSNHRPFDRLINSLLRLTIKKTSKHSTSCPLWGESTDDRLTKDHKCNFGVSMPWSDALISSLSDSNMRQWTSRHWFRQWLVARSAPSHYLNQCWDIINWTLGKKLRSNLNEIHTFSFQKMHLKMSSGKWRPFCRGLNVIRKWLGVKRQVTSMMLMISGACQRLTKPSSSLAHG